MSVRIEGLDQLRRKLRKLPAQVQKEVSTALAESAERIADGARSRVPVESGALKNSIRVRQSERGMSVSVEAAAEHAKFIEFGTRRTVAKPFMVPAFEEAKPQVVAEIEQAVRRALRQAAKG